MHGRRDFCLSEIVVHVNLKKKKKFQPYLGLVIYTVYAVSVCVFPLKLRLTSLCVRSVFLI